MQLFEKKISSIQNPIPMLEKVARMGRPLVIIAEDVEGEVLVTLVVNKIRGNINSIAATATELKQKKHLIEDALSAARAAVEEGIVPGGGVTLLKCVKAVEGVKIGVNIVKRA